MIVPQPILIIGTQRSGSNLLRIMLNQLDEIEAPHPPHILHTFYPLISNYGDINAESNFRMLIDDVVRFTEANPVRWHGMNFNSETVFERCKRRSLVEIFRVLYELKSENKQAAYWCCKSMANLYYVPQIEQENIKPFYIYLVRNGRDAAASFKNAIVGEKHIYFIAQQWKQDQELARDIVSQYSNRSAVLYFEEFIDDPEKALTPVLKQLGLNWRPEILEFYKSDEAIRTASAGNMWKNVIRPVDSNNKKHYSEKLSRGEIEIFESVAGKVLTQSGYELNGELNTRIFSETEIAAFQFENNASKILIRDANPHDVEIRKPQEEVISAIKERFNL